MAFQTKDKKKTFGSSMVAKRYDQFHPGEDSEKSEQTGQPKVQNTPKKPSEPKEEPRTDAMGLSKKSQPSVNSTSLTKGMHQEEGSPEASMDKEESRTDENGESDSPESVVAAHGRPHTVTVHSDHTANKHKVMSHHSDGHMHESMHSSAAEAHEHARQLGSSEGGNSEAENDPDSGNQNLGDLSSIFSGGM
jgi:hypothetical protein